MVWRFARFGHIALFVCLLAAMTMRAVPAGAAASRILVAGSLDPRLRACPGRSAERRAEPDQGRQR